MTRLDVISDPVCPWCYLGAANLMRAVTAGQGHPFQLRWRPYQLDPALPPEGADRAAHMAAKFGADGTRLRAAHDRLIAMGRESGITYRFERITRAPNTLDAHRLIRWAEAAGVQTRTAMALFRRYSSSARTSPIRPCSARRPRRAEWTARRVARLVGGDADRDAVRAAAEAAREMGVTGVPTFLIAGLYVLAGAQPVEVWEDVIGQLAAATQSV